MAAGFNPVIKADGIDLSFSGPLPYRLATAQ